MATSAKVLTLVFVEEDEEAYIGRPEWAAEQLGLGPDQRRIAMHADGRTELAHVAGPGATLCRVPEGQHEHDRKDRGPRPGS